MAGPVSARRPTIADIARLAGVSKGAVSYALNGRPGVSDATRSRVLRIAEELGWQANSAARALSGSRVDAVGLVLTRAPEMLGLEPFFMEFLAGIESEFAPRGVALLLQLVADHDAALAAYQRWWQGRRVDGVLIMDLHRDDVRVPVVTELGLPALVVGGPQGVGELGCLWSDDAQAITVAIEYLAGLGHRRIARVGGPPELRAMADRTESFHRAVERFGLSDARVLDADFSAERGEAATRELLSVPADRRPTAIIYDNDVMAVAGMAVAAELGLNVPADLSLLAWDDSPLCRLTRPALSAMSRDVEAFGRHAARLLLDLLDGEDIGQVSDGSAVLTERSSTAPPPGRPAR